MGNHACRHRFKCHCKLALACSLAVDQSPCNFLLLQNCSPSARENREPCHSKGRRQHQQAKPQRKPIVTKSSSMLGLRQLAGAELLQMKGLRIKSLAQIFQLCLTAAPSTAAGIRLINITGVDLNPLLGHDKNALLDCFHLFQLGQYLNALCHFPALRCHYISPVCLV